MKMPFRYNKAMRRGYITITVLVFATVFGVILTALIGFVFTQNRLQIAKEHHARALQVAEAGLDYYKWFLAHFPGDVTHGTGEPGPYELAYADPETGTVGSFSLEVEGETFCGAVNAVAITSTGWTDSEPGLTRTVFAKYARPSVAEYSFIINSNVWAGADRIIRGPYHSNGVVSVARRNMGSSPECLCVRSSLYRDAG